MDFTGSKIYQRALPIILVLTAVAFGCAGRPGGQEGVLGTKEHHISTGYRLMRIHYFDDAKRAFNLALQIDGCCSPAYRGLGLVYGEEGDFEAAFQAMNRARDCAKEDQDMALVYVGFMRLNILEKGVGWLRKVEEDFSIARTIKDDLPDAFYEMGLAYKEAGKTPEAIRSFKQVVEMNRRLVADAKHQLAGLTN